MLWFVFVASCLAQLDPLASKTAFLTNETFLELNATVDQFSNTFTSFPFATVSLVCVKQSASAASDARFFCA